MRKPEPLKIVLADDHRMVLSGLRHLLESGSDCRILAAVEDVGQLLGLPELPTADVVLMDLNLPGPAGEEHSAELPGLKALPKVKKATSAKVLVLSMHDESAVVLRALHLGASGFVTKSSPGDRLFDALEALRQGQIYLDPAILGLGDVQGPSVPPPALGKAKETAGALSRQEREIAHLLLAGMTQKAISHRLGISPQTTHTYKRRLKEKLQAGNDVELLRKLSAALAGSSD